VSVVRAVTAVATVAAALWAAGPASASPAPLPGTLAVIVRPRASQSAGVLYLASAEGASRKRCDMPAQSLAWSPDGKLLALWEGTTDAPGRVWVVTAAGFSAPRLLTGKGADPVWSPDGARIAFARQGGGLAIVGADGSDLREMAGTERGYAPAWSPDGRSLAFARASGGGGSVWSVAAHGGVAERLTFCARPLGISWSPDGQSLAVIERDPDRMAWPRLSLYRRGAEMLAPVGLTLGGRTVWSDDGRILLVGNGTFDPVTGSALTAVELAGVCAGLLPSGEVLSFELTVAFPGKVALLALRAGTRRTAAEITGLEAGRIVAAAWTGRTQLASEPIVQPITQEPVPSQPIVPAAAKAGSPLPMVFPVCGPVQWSDTFLASRDGGARQHQGQDLMAPKMREAVAAFDGVVALHRPRVAGGHFWLVLTGDNGWTATYLHLNNDTPGTDDGLGGDRYAFAPGIETGVRVRAGELLGWVGDSGNAEDTAPHLHFELAPTATRVPVNPAQYLEAAEHLDAPSGATAPVQEPTPIPEQ